MEIDIPLFVLIGAIVATSMIGFSNPQFVDKHIFNTSAIYHANQWDRLITSSFLHADGLHLFINMYVLYMFAPLLIHTPGLGYLFFFMIYFGAVIVGGLLSYFMNRHNLRYTALGASGGVTGVVMAFTVIRPDAQLGIIFVPLYIPGYIFGFLYLTYSIYAMHANRDNIGHDAHLGGAIFGLFIPIAMYPQLLVQNFFKIALLLLPMAYLGYYLYQRR